MINDHKTQRVTSPPLNKLLTKRNTKKMDTSIKSGKSPNPKPNQKERRKSTNKANTIGKERKEKTRQIGIKTTNPVPHHKRQETTSYQTEQRKGRNTKTHHQ